MENERTVTGMAEYISKESAISIFRAKAEMAVCTPAQPYFDRAAKMLELLTAADVAPVRHGRFRKKSYLRNKERADVGRQKKGGDRKWI